MPMTMTDYQRLVLTYKSPFAQADPVVIADVSLLLETVLAQASATTKLTALFEQSQRELAGARTTMLALTCALGGTIEIPHAAIDGLHPQDALLVSDVLTPSGLMKRFGFRAHDTPIVCPRCQGDRGNAGGATCELCHGEGVIAPPDPAPAPVPAPSRLHLVR